MTRLAQTSLKLVLTLALLAASSASTLAGDDGAKTAALDFRAYCAPCHGLDGQGGGPVAVALKTPPADLTLISKRHNGRFPSEAVYVKIEGTDMPAAHGSSEMPIWGMWFTGQAVGEGLLLEDAKPAAEEARKRIRALVRYIETIQE